MGITLKQLTDTVSQIKDYILNKTHKIDQISYAQKTVNTELDYGIFEVTAMTINKTTPLVFASVVDGSMELSEQGYIKLQAGKTYAFHTGFYRDEYNTGYWLVDESLNVLTEANTSRTGSYIYKAEKDIEVTFIAYSDTQLTPAWACVNVYEINRQIVIDPVEYINKTQGLEDSPVGHIISHMGTSAPKHYLVCDGSEYNITDYPHLAEHIESNFGIVNYFGGDGLTTFAVPDLKERFLKGSDNPGINEEAGLPNITGVTSAYDWDGHTRTGSFYDAGAGNQSGLGGTMSETEWSNIGFNASRSNSIYGNSDTVTPANTSILYCIKYEPTYYMQVKNTNYMQPNLYSEEERIVGCWINGKPLYEKTVLFTLSDTSNPQNVAHNIENIEEIVYSDINIANGTIPIGYRNNASTIWFTASIGLIFIELLRSDAGHWGQKEGKAVIQYTKTTDAENSFTNDMIQDYIIQSSESEPYSEEEVTNAVNEIWQ